MYTPPRAPKVKARLPATVPRNPQNKSSASSAKASDCANAAATTVAASKLEGWVTPLSACNALYRSDKPWPHTARSAEAWPPCRCASQANTACSRGVMAAKETCPPSPSMGTQPPRPLGSRPDTPKPVPGPIKPMAALGAGLSPEICRSSCACSKGRAKASAVKSLSTRSCWNPNCVRRPWMEKLQWWLVILTTSPNTGLAMAIQQRAGAGR